MRTPTIAPVLAALLFRPVLWAAATLDVYFIDVEGGQSTLIVTPAGQTLLVDAGYPRLNGLHAVTALPVLFQDTVVCLHS